MTQHNTHLGVGKRTGIYVWACTTLKIWTTLKLTDQLLQFWSGKITGAGSFTKIYTVSGFQHIYMNSKPKCVQVDFILLISGRIWTVYHVVTINDRLDLWKVQLTKTMDNEKLNINGCLYEYSNSKALTKLIMNHIRIGWTVNMRKIVYQ